MKKNNPYLYLIPSFLVIFLVIFVPLFYALFISFIDLSKNVNKLSNPDLWNFIGFKNYMDVIKGEFFWKSLGRTLYFTITSVGFEFIIGLSIALLLNEKFKGRGLVRGLMLIPWAFPTIVSAVLWRWMYDSNNGTITNLLDKLGIHGLNILGSGFSAMNAIIIADVWKNTAFIALILLAALQALPISAYEAAKVEGASAFYRLRKITLPLLSSAILVALVMRTMEAFKVFDIIYIMTGGGPAGGTQVLSFYTYSSSMMSGNFSYGASISFLMSGFIMVFALIYIKILYRNVD
ncbi:MAG: sugar ABC transporter permease [Paenibacillaceae bacterium]